MKLIDMHCDTISLLMKTGKEHLHRNQLSIDIEKLKRAHSMAQFFACFVHAKDCQYDMESCYRKVLEMIAYGKKELSKCSDSISIAYHTSEVFQNCDAGKISAVLTLEEGGVLCGKMEYLEELYRQGIRLITLTWNYENCIGFPNSKDPKLMQSGLKPFGIEVVRRMNELSMLIDVSHLSDGGFWDVIEHSQKPIVASHSNARALRNHPRNLTDEMIRALADNGGVCGINFYPYFLTEDGKASVEDIANHIEHMYRIGGEDVIAIGTDFDGFDDGELNMKDIGEMNQVYDAIRRRGFTERQTDKIFNRNILRVMQDNTKNNR